jgi:hypothetical protein
MATTNLLDYEIHLRKAENGFIINVGCKIFVSKDWKEVETQLTAYMTGKTTKWIEEQIEKTQTCEPIPTCL